MALTNKQIKKKLRHLARQDAPIRCGDLREAGPYQFSSPQPLPPQRKWVSRIAACAACAAVAVSAVLLASPFLRSMGPQSTGSVSSGEDAQSSSPVSQTLSMSESQIQYVRTNGYVEWLKYPRFVRITSIEDLRKYYETYSGIYYLGHMSESPGWLDAVADYDDDWFGQNDLLMLVLEEGSGSIRHRVSVENADDGAYLRLERIVPNAQTCDMAEWHVLIEMEKSAAFAGLKVDGEETPIVSPVYTVQEAVDMLTDYMRTCAYKVWDNGGASVLNIEAPAVEKLSYGDIKNLPLHYFYGDYNPGYDEAAVWRVTFTTGADGVLGPIVYYLSPSGHVFASALRE